jgi:hypothetical protein
MRLAQADIDGGSTMARGRRVKDGKRVAAAAMVELGIPLRQVGEELGISKDSAANFAKDPTLDPEEVERCKAKMTGRFIVASDRLLTRCLDGINTLDPYRAMIASGIAHDHYLRATQAGKAHAAGSLTQILILIDQRSRGQGDGGGGA